MRRKRVIVAAAALGAILTAVFVAAAIAGGSLAAPVITVKPANPTTSTSASFTYTDSSTITKFQCQHDGGTYVDCGTNKAGSSVSYSGLAAGSHTFYVKAISGSTTSSVTSYTWTIDLTPPTVSSIKCSCGSNPTNASSVSWTVTFSESVTGVDKTDFALVKTGLGGTPTITGATGSGTTWTVTASTGSGSGTLGLNLVDDDSIKDTAGNKLGGTGTGNGNFTGQVCTIDRTAPTVVSIKRADPNPTNASAVHWTVVFSESVTGVATSNFATIQSGLSGSTSVTAVSGSGTTWTVTANTGTSGSGTLQLKLSSATGIKDLAGNALSGTLPCFGTGALPCLGETYTVRVPYVVSINRADADNTTASSVHWTVTFSQSVTGVDSGDFQLVPGGGLTGTPAITTVAGSGSSYTVTATTGTGPGTLGLNLVDDDTINAGGIKLGGNGIGNGNFTGQVYTINAAPGMPFAVKGNATNTLYPGGSSPINLVFANPNGVPITVTSVSVTISSTSNGACGTGNFSIPQQLLVTVPVIVPANSTNQSLLLLGIPTANWPIIKMTDSGNQNACQNVTVNLSYSGSAQS